MTTEKTYDEMPTPRQKDNQKVVRHDGWHRWISREDGPGGMYRAKSKYLCLSCKFSAKVPEYFSGIEKCPNCGSEKIVSIGRCARVPRKNASKKVWDNFILNFVSSK